MFNSHRTGEANRGEKNLPWGGPPGNRAKERFWESKSLMVEVQILGPPSTKYRNETWVNTREREKKKNNLQGFRGKANSS